MESFFIFLFLLIFGDDLTFLAFPTMRWTEKKSISDWTSLKERICSENVPENETKAAIG